MLPTCEVGHTLLFDPVSEQKPSLYTVLMRFSSPKVHQIQNFSVPDPAGGAYSAPPDPLAGGEGDHWPLPRTPPPLSAFRASSVGPSGLALSIPIATPLTKRVLYKMEQQRPVTNYYAAE